MGAHSARKTRPLPRLHEHRKERKEREESSWKRAVAWAIVVVLVIFTALVLIGAFVPPQKTPAHASVNPPPPGLMTVRHGNVQAVVRNTDHGREVVVVNTSKTESATATFTFTDLCVGGTYNVAYDVGSQHYSTPIRSIKVTLPPQHARVYLLTKE